MMIGNLGNIYLLFLILWRGNATSRPHIGMVSINLKSNVKDFVSIILVWFLIGLISSKFTWSKEFVIYSFFYWNVLFCLYWFQSIVFILADDLGYGDVGWNNKGRVHWKKGQFVFYFFNPKYLQPAAMEHPLSLYLWLWSGFCSD